MYCGGKINRDRCADASKECEAPEAALMYVVGRVEGAHFRFELFDRRRILKPQWADFVMETNTTVVKLHSTGPEWNQNLPNHGCLGIRRQHYSPASSCAHFSRKARASLTARSMDICPSPHGQTMVGESSFTGCVSQIPSSLN